uniref:ELM2 domain-containing protein n=1 Tax=Graphocephala atropunctata TaxID=36148 RepID=A0A1B6LWM7_9HEMI
MDKLPTPPQEEKSDDYSSMYEEEDNEDTIDVEEALEPIMDPLEELKFLAEDLNESLPELRSRWGKRQAECPADEIFHGPSTSKRAKKTEYAGGTYCSAGFPEPLDGEASELIQLYVNDGKLKEEDDKDYVPFNFMQATQAVRVGSEYQAVLPEVTTMSNVKETPRAELLWSPPTNLNDTELNLYIKEATKILYNVNSTPTNSHNHIIMFLQCLMNCGYETQPALYMVKEKIQKACKENIKKSPPTKDKVDKPGEIDDKSANNVIDKEVYEKFDPKEPNQ